MTSRSSDKPMNKTIVRAFLEAAGIPIQEDDIQEDDIQDADEPSPDVRCTLADGTPTAFELTEAVDQDKARNVRASFASKTRMCDHYRQLPLADQTKLRRVFANAYISVRVKDGTTDRRFKEVVPRVFNLLLDCSCDTQGSIEKRKLPTDVEEIRITRGKWSTGPCFNCGQALWVANCMIKRIKAKFSKQYECDCPIELLVHSKTCPLEPDGLWKDEVHDFVTRNMDKSRFCRVSVFDWVNSTIRYTYPER
jgi:hypothetical protein